MKDLTVYGTPTEGRVASIAESLDPDYREVTVGNKEYILMLLKFVLRFTTNEIAPETG